MANPPQKPKAVGKAPEAPAPPPAAAPQANSALVGALANAAKSAITAAVLEKRPYLKYAFANPYNLSLFDELLTVSALTLNPVLLLARNAFFMVCVLAHGFRRLLPPYG